MKKPIFAGAGVAIVTPFKDETLKINFPLFEELINEQIENGTDAIVLFRVNSGILLSWIFEKIIPAADILSLLHYF